MGIRTPKFTISANVQGRAQMISVAREETTDGISIYKCFLDNALITELRMDADQWQQLWGHLSETEMQSIGEAIEGVENI